MVLEAILTSRQVCEKLQCLYENLMSNKFCEMHVLKKIYEFYTKATQQRILLTNFWGHTSASISPDACFRFSTYLSAIFPADFSQWAEKCLQTNV